MSRGAVESAVYRDDEMIEQGRPPTPPGQRARLEYQSQQIDQLVREKHAMDRRHTAKLAQMEQVISSLRSQISQVDIYKRRVDAKDAELGQLKAEGEAMREELNLISEIAQRKAVLAIATEQMQSVEMEQRLLQAESARVMRDHKISLFQAKEADLEMELAEKDFHLADLEAKLEEANTSLEHQRAAQIKADKLSFTAAQEEVESVQQEVQTLEAKLSILETKLKASTAREKELKTDLEEAMSNAQKGSTDQEKHELQKSLRETKTALERKTDELSDLQEELQLSKEREKALKTKVKDAALERARLVGVEEELQALKLAKSSTVFEPPKPAKMKTVKPVEHSDEEVISPPKRAKAISKRSRDGSEDQDAPYRPEGDKPLKVKPKAPLREKCEQTLRVEKVLEEKEPEKKKKRKLLGVKPTFNWDPVMNSADGVIPAYLSPKAGKGAVGLIPRAGFGKSLASSRNLGRLQ